MMYPDASQRCLTRGLVGASRIRACGWQRKLREEELAQHGIWRPWPHWYDSPGPRNSPAIPRGQLRRCRPTSTREQTRQLYGGHCSSQPRQAGACAPGWLPRHRAASQRPPRTGQSTARTRCRRRLATWPEKSADAATTILTDRSQRRAVVWRDGASRSMSVDRCQSGRSSEPSRPRPSRR